MDSWTRLPVMRRSKPLNLRVEQGESWFQHERAYSRVDGLVHVRRDPVQCRVDGIRRTDCAVARRRRDLLAARGQRSLRL